MNIEERVKQFEKFYHFLMKESPRGYIPWFFPCDKKGKNPSTSAILKINPLSKGSWHHESARLNKEQCIEHLREGYNIGISARTGDPLIIGDIDEAKYMNQMPKDTLTTTSRKRCGGHFFGWDRDGSAKINLPTDCGEIRSSNQYVISPGSYVPFHLENEKEKRAFDNLTKEAQKDKLLGYYTIKESVIPREISFNELPKFFIEKEMENIESEAKIKNRNEEKSFKQEGKYTELFNLKVSDIVGLIPANKRQGHPLHESDTDANFSLSKDGALGMCWRHLVSLNAVQYLCVKAGYKSCVDAGTPHKGRGISKIKGDKKSYEVAYQEALKLGLISEYKPILEKSKSHIEHETKNGNLYDFIGQGKFGKYVKIDAVVEAIKEEYDFVTIFGKRGEEIWIYDEGIYKPNGREIIETYSENLLNNYAKTNVIKEILNKIKRQTSIDRKEFDKIPKELLPLKNGILNFDTGEFLEYSPKYYFKTKIDVLYKQKQNCSAWLKFIEETFYSEDIPVIQEWFGFCLYRNYFIKKGFIGIGEGDTGKSVFQNVLLSFFGIENTCGLNLQKIVQDNGFSKVSLYNKYINLYDDMSSRDINDGGGFKMVTGRSPITAEYKFGDEFQFINFAKMTFCCNKIPPIKDTDDFVYYNRWLPIPFDNIVLESEQDKFLVEKLTTPGELSGVLNWALIGLKRILKNGRFSYNKTREEIKAIMDRSSNPLAEFTQDCLEESQNSKITKEDMFKIYTEWAIQKNKSRLTLDKLGKQLPRYATFLIDTRDGKVRCWNNVKINESNTTLHTFYKNICNISTNSNIRMFNKIKKKVCNPSQNNNKESQKELKDNDNSWSKEDLERLNLTKNEENKINFDDFEGFSDE